MQREVPTWNSRPRRCLFLRKAGIVAGLGLGLLGGAERALGARAVGIDVSDWQSSGINWSTLKNTYGITFGWAKATEGVGSAQSNFKTYMANAKSAGVLIGAYHYARYDLNTNTVGATSEANYFWSVTKSYLVGGGYYIQPMLDVEASFTGYTKTTLSQWVVQWCLTVSNNAYASGYIVKPCIYCSASHAATYLDSTVAKWNADIADWYSDHSTALASAQAASGPPYGISPWSTWQFWQYDDQNAGQAITTGDGDIYNGTLAQLQASSLMITPVAITITNQPVAQIVTAGTNVSFTVGASGAGTLYYQWRFNGTKVTGATASSYTKNNVQYTDGGSYTVVVTNTSSSVTSSVAVLTVHAAPVITAQPTNVTVPAGASATFSVTAVGSPTLSYQWRCNGANISGAFGTSLTITNAAATNSGTYVVLVANVYGQATSSNALLTVSDPYITTQPQSQTVSPGSPASFTVVAGGTPPLSYLWTKNGTTLTDGGNVSGASASSLNLASVQVGDVGTYAVTVSNVSGVLVSSNAVLTAAFAPVITTQPACQQVRAASTASLAVTVAGPGPMSYQWRKDGTNLVDGGDVVGAATSSLSVSNVQALDAGNYSILVSNLNGTVTSSNGLLSVWPLLGWGRNDYGQADIPSGLSNVASVASGLYHSLALRTDGTVIAWGAGTNNTGTNQNYGQAMVPGGLSNVVGIACGGYHSLAIKADGTVVAWGAGTTTGASPNYGQAMVPAGLTNVVGVAAGIYHSVALKADGTVVAWGAGTAVGSSPNDGQAMVPAGLTGVVAVAAGGLHSLALKADGTVVAWGAGTSIGTSPNYGQALVPTGLTGVVAVAGGLYHSLALRSDGTLLAWGSNNNGQTNIPAGLTNVVGIAAGSYQNLALLPDGRIAAWGSGSYGQTNIPTALANAIKVVGGNFQNLVLEGDGRPVVTVQPVSLVVTSGTSVQLPAMAVGVQPLSYQWQLNGADIPGATSTVLSLASVQPDDAGLYALIVSNSVGTATSSSAALTVLFPPAVTNQPDDQIVVAGTPATFTVEATGTAPLAYQWQLNGTNLAGATDSTLNLASAQPSDAGSYSAVVSNALGSVTSSNAILTVVTPPVITAQPTDLTVAAGGNATFSVQATSLAPLEYRWYFNQTNVLDETDAATLSLTAVQASQAGGYSVEVHNVAGSVTSSVAMLTVIVPAELLTGPVLTPEGVFQFSLAGIAGSNYVVEVSSNLTDWVPLQTNVAPFSFADTNAASLPMRFYWAHPTP